MSKLEASSTETEKSDAGTDTEKSDSPLGRPAKAAKPKAKARTSVQKARSSKGSWSDFAVEFLKKLETVQKLGRACSYCAFECFNIAKGHLDSLRIWREQFTQLPSEAADRELLWIFGRTCQQEPNNAVSKSKSAAVLDTSRTTDTEDSNEQSKARPGQTQNQEGQSTDTEQSNMARKTRRPYGKRLCTKKPSVQLPMLGADVHVCKHGALFLLGIGDSRVQRAAGHVLLKNSS